MTALNGSVYEILSQNHHGHQSQWEVAALQVWQRSPAESQSFPNLDLPEADGRLFAAAADILW